MKKVFFTALMGIVALTAGAQNIQIHWDLGKHLYNDDLHNRMDVTLTYEGFKADGTGSWYYFIDADFNKNGMLGAYTEISREFNVKKLSDAITLAAHAEVDAGLATRKQYASNQFQPAILIGPALNWHNTNFSKTASLQVMYKQFTGQNWNTDGDYAPQENTKPYASFQITGVWGMNFCSNKLTFSGFFDFWRGINSKNGHGCLVFLTEPQLWYNVSKHCSFGTEWELSNNFIYRNCGNFANDGFYFNPTLAFKYNF